MGALTAATGIGGVKVEALRRTDRRPEFAGVVGMSATPSVHCCDFTGTGVAALGTIEFGDTVMATITFFLYGDDAMDIVARETPRWQAWLQERFPMPNAERPVL